MRRTRRLTGLVALALVLGCCATVGLAQTASAEKRPPYTDFRGAFVCGRDGQPLAGARVELWTQWRTGLPKVWPNARQIGAQQADANGGWGFRVTGDETNLFVRVVLSSSMADVGNWLVPWNWYADTVPNQNDVWLQDYGTQSVPGGQCALWNGLYDAGRAYQSEYGSRAPFGEIQGQYDAVTAGVPFTPYTDVWWPYDYPVYQNGRSVALHEFAHAVRAKFDGSYGHFVDDSVKYSYLQHHSATSCARTNIGFAFNEGWAEYWARQVQPPCSKNPTDYGVERNVAAGLLKLQQDCRLTRGAMIGVLARNRGRIHSFSDFSKALGCTPPPPVLKLGKKAKPKITSLMVAKARKSNTAWLKAQNKEIRLLKADVRLAKKLAKKPVPCATKPCAEQLARLAAPALAKARLAQAQATHRRFLAIKGKAAARQQVSTPVPKLTKKLGKLRASALNAGRRAALPGLKEAVKIVRKAPGAQNADRAQTLKTLKRMRNGVKNNQVDALQAFTVATSPAPVRSGASPAGITPVKVDLNLRAISGLTLGCHHEWTISKNGSESFAGTLKPAKAGTPVTVVYEYTSDSGTHRYSGTATTDATGAFSHSLPLDSATMLDGQLLIWSIHAEYAGDAARSPAVSATCQALAHPD